MKIAVTGASGLIGGALVAALRADGHEVLRLVRRTPADGRRAPLGPPAPPDRPAAARRRRRGDQPGRRRRSARGRGPRLQGAPAHAAGWTPRRPSARRSPRRRPPIPTGRGCCCRPPPSATTATPATGRSTRATPPGSDFLAGLCARWEAATAPAEDAGRPGRAAAHRPGDRPRRDAHAGAGPGVPAGPGRPARLGPAVLALDQPAATRSTRSASCSPPTSPAR